MRDNNVSLIKCIYDTLKKTYLKEAIGTGGKTMTTG
jgi:hypothetical protein